MSWWQDLFDRHPRWLRAVENVWWIATAYLALLLLIHMLLT